MHTTAIVGCAHIHAPGFIRRINERLDVTAKYVWDHDASRAELRASEVGAEAVTSLDRIWDDTDITSVVICAETNRHLPLVKAAASAGKHMFVEKPLGMGSADAFEMAKAIESAGVIFQTGYFKRGEPIHQYLRSEIENGSFGTITRLRHTNFHSGSLRDMFTPEWLWMTRVEEAGIGGFGDLATHSLDIMMWMLGEVTEVTAALKPVTGTYGEIDETGEALLKFENGVIGSLAGGWVDVADPVTLILSGTEGHAYVRNGELFLLCENISGAGGVHPWNELPAPWSHAFELFFDAVTGKDDVSLVSPSEAAARSSVMEALYLAASEGIWKSPL